MRFLLLFFLFLSGPVWSADSMVYTSNTAVSNPSAVRLSDGTQFFESMTGPTGDKYLGVASLQDVHVSVSNSTTTNIINGTSWTGLTESTLAIVGIQVNAYSNETLTVEVQQSTDGTNWDIDDQFTVFSLSGTSRTFQATASYFRVKATNMGSLTTTALRIQTTLCPMVEALPRALDSNGNLKVSFQQFRERSQKILVSITTVTQTEGMVVVPAQGDRIYTDLSSIHFDNNANNTNTIRVFDGGTNTIMAFTLTATSSRDVVWGTALLPQTLPNKPWVITLSATPGGGGIVRATFFGFRVRE